MVNRLIRTNQTHHPCKYSLCFQKYCYNYNKLRWSAIDLHYPANSQNCQIVQDVPAYKQLILLNINY